MTDATAQNPFAPPRALVQDQFNSPGEMVTATRVSRLLAVLIDGSPVLAFVVAGLIVVFATIGTAVFSRHFDPSTMSLAVLGTFCALAFVALIAWAVWNVVLVYKYGQTVGKKVMGIRVVRMDGSRVTFARFFFLRWMAMAVITWICSAISHALGNVVSLVDALVIFGAAHRCLHDYIADTQVVTAESSPNATLEGSRGF